jgi:hypothetical protein
MTIEKTCFIHPKDITAVQFKCTHCEATTSVPVARLEAGDLKTFLTSECHYCRTASGFANGSELEYLLTFTTILEGLTRILKDKNLQFSFQMKCPE